MCHKIYLKMAALMLAIFLPSTEAVVIPIEHVAAQEVIKTLSAKCFEVKDKIIFCSIKEAGLQTESAAFVMQDIPLKNMLSETKQYFKNSQDPKGQNMFKVTCNAYCKGVPTEACTCQEYTPFKENPKQELPALPKHICFIFLNSEAKAPPQIGEELCILPPEVRQRSHLSKSGSRRGFFSRLFTGIPPSSTRDSANSRLARSNSGRTHSISISGSPSRTHSAMTVAISDGRSPSHRPDRHRSHDRSKKI